MLEENGHREQLSRLIRSLGLAPPLLLVLFGLWWASFSGFLMPPQLWLSVTFNFWQGLGLAALGAVELVCVLVLRRNHAWIPAAIAGGGLLVLQLARFAVFGRFDASTDWWVVFAVVVFVGLAGSLTVRLRTQRRQA